MNRNKVVCLDFDGCILPSNLENINDSLEIFERNLKRLASIKDCNFFYNEFLV